MKMLKGKSGLSIIDCQELLLLFSWFKHYVTLATTLIIAPFPFHKCGMLKKQ